MPNILERLRGFFTPRRYYWNWSTPEEFPSVEGMTARELYASQANLHAVVSFLSDSVAQLPLKVYRRVGENNRQRDRESRAALLLYRPNADQTEYEFINSFAVEFLLHGCSFVWLLPDGESPSGYQLRLIPCEWIRETESATNYAPDVLHVSSGTHGEVIEIPRTQFIPFRMVIALFADGSHPVRLRRLIALRAARANIMHRAENGHRRKNKNCATAK